jgi:hypothetical protein
MKRRFTVSRKGGAPGRQTPERKWSPTFHKPCYAAATRALRVANSPGRTTRFMAEPRTALKSLRSRFHSRNVRRILARRWCRDSGRASYRTFHRAWR